MKIEYVDYAIANRFEDKIEINQVLKGYPELHDAILQHEMQHTNKSGFTKEDFILDIGPTKVNYWKLLMLMCHYPKMFLQFAPIYKKGKTFFYDINMSIVWGVMLIVIALSIYLSI